MKTSLLDQCLRDTTKWLKHYKKYGLPPYPHIVFIKEMITLDHNDEGWETNLVQDFLPMLEDEWEVCEVDNHRSTRYIKSEYGDFSLPSYIAPQTKNVLCVFRLNNRDKWELDSCFSITPKDAKTFLTGEWDKEALYGLIVEQTMSKISDFINMVAKDFGDMLPNVALWVKARKGE